MAEERKGIPCDAEYVSALGLAAFAFARCEWQVVWCCERLKPGAVERITSDEMTAGEIANYFGNLVRNLPPSDDRLQLAEAAREFGDLVKDRNRLLHGKPCTAPSGAQRLSAERILELQDVERFADAFAACGAKLNSIYYGLLNDFQPPTVR